MQNSILKNKSKKQFIIDTIRSFKVKMNTTLSTDYIPQMEAQQIIDKINIALSFKKRILIQIRLNSDPNSVVNYKGSFFQNINGSLFLQTEKDIIKIDPAMIQAVV
ncbi:MAG: hypothetical protein LBC17_03245 [Lactobacillaceae bacterium]|jgi:hypothetical protein|nr:hypothetical protein [Lactobacillaceae bacterium]